MQGNIFIFQYITVKKIEKERRNHSHASIDLMREFMFTFGDLRVGYKSLHFSWLTASLVISAQLLPCDTDTLQKHERNV